MWVTFHRSERFTNQLIVTIHPFYIIRNHLTHVINIQREATGVSDVQSEAEGDNGDNIFQIEPRGNELQVKRYYVCKCV